MTRESTAATAVTRIAIAIALVVALLSSSGCATIADPPMPQGKVNRQIILDYQNGLIAAQHARDAQYLRNTRLMSAGCQAADVITTLVGVNQGLKEGNPIHD